MVTLGLTQLRRGRDDAWLQVLIMIPKYRWLLLLLKTISATNCDERQHGRWPRRDTSSETA